MSQPVDGLALFASEIIREPDQTTGTLMDHPLIELGGSGPPLHISIANGFPPETYRPLLDPLTDRYRVVCLPLRPLWPDPPPPETLDSWHDPARDLLAGMRAHHLTDVIGVGHSMGGIFTMLAAAHEPDRFRALILLDPTALPPLALLPIKLLDLLGMKDRFPLVEQALRRRDHFPDRQTAFDYWRGKSLFSDWDDETLWLYVQGLTEEDPTGDGLRLAWSPEWEARYYATVITDPYRQARRLRSTDIPMLFIRGADTNTFRAPSERRMRRILPGATYRVVEDAGHLFPQAAPDRTRQIMVGWLDSLSGG